MALLLLPLISSCATTNAIDAARSTVPITVDGEIGDWVDPIEYYVFDKERVSVGVRNDDENLFVVLFTKDRPLQAWIARTGIVAWIDGDMDSKPVKTFGVRFDGTGEGPPARGSESRGETGQGPLIQQPDRSTFTLIRDQSTEIRASGERDGLAVAASNPGGVFGLEIRIPLGGAAPTPTDGQIRLGWELPGIDARQRASRGGGNEPRFDMGFGGQGGGKGGGGRGGGMSRGGGGGGGRPGGRPPGGGRGGAQGPPEGSSPPSPPRACELWVTITLL